jgi:hypothetical protein
MPSEIGKALGYSMGDSEEEAPMSETPVKEAPKASASAEVLAMKQFDRAKDPEAKVQAMKDFLEACGLY